MSNHSNHSPLLKTHQTPQNHLASERLSLLQLSDISKINNTLGATDDREQLFPSTQSAFSFQPKYFKPNTTKAADNIGASNLSGNSLEQKTKFFEGKSVIVKGKGGNGNESTPNYSGSSTIVTNSRNPSIIPKDLKSGTSSLINKSMKKGT